MSMKNLFPASAGMNHTLFRTIRFSVPRICGDDLVAVDVRPGAMRGQRAQQTRPPAGDSHGQRCC